MGLWGEGLYFPGAKDSVSSVSRMSGGGQSHLSIVNETLPTLALLFEGHSIGRYNFIFFSLPFCDHKKGTINFTLALLIRKLTGDIGVLTLA